jgi:hypothetical protein
VLDVGNSADVTLAGTFVADVNVFLRELTERTNLANGIQVKGPI